MRIATWNIRAGGGKRTEQIARVILQEEPDILVLTEYRPVPGKALIDLIQPLNYYVRSGQAVGPQNCACILSRQPIEPFVATSLPASLHRWVAISIPAYGLTVLGVHVPNQCEIWNKREFWDCVDAFSSETIHKRSLIIGDLNTALDEDCEGGPIREAVCIKKLLDAG